MSAPDAPSSPATALVLFSGGADSTICLHWALRRFRVAEALGFDYGQRHRVELDCAREICARLGVAHRVLPVDSLAALGGNALVDGGREIALRGERGLPTTFVPGRNLLFLVLAAARAWQLGATDLVAGMCQADSSGYPDCREDAVRATEAALALGLGAPLRVHTPLMHLTKAQSVLLARDLGALETLALTHTCYEGRRPPCGACPSCLLRAKGFAEAGLDDPLLAARR